MFHSCNLNDSIYLDHVALFFRYVILILTKRLTEKVCRLHNTENKVLTLILDSVGLDTTKPTKLQTNEGLMMVLAIVLFIAYCIID
jgi:hypothetical protein